MQGCVRVRPRGFEPRSQSSSYLESAGSRVAETLQPGTGQAAGIRRGFSRTARAAEICFPVHGMPQPRTPNLHLSPLGRDGPRGQDLDDAAVKGFWGHPYHVGTARRVGVEVKEAAFAHQPANSCMQTALPSLSGEKLSSGFPANQRVSDSAGSGSAVPAAMCANGAHFLMHARMSGCEHTVPGKPSARSRPAKDQRASRACASCVAGCACGPARCSGRTGWGLRVPRKDERLH